MGLDSHIAAIAAHRISADAATVTATATAHAAATATATAHAIDRPRFFADINDLELRLAIIDDRFERLASRSDDAYQGWRRDTVTKARELALRARALEDAGDLAVHHRRRVAALLVTLRSRVGALDARHAAFMDRRGRIDILPGRQPTITDRMAR